MDISAEKEEVFKFDVGQCLRIQKEEQDCEIDVLFFSSDEDVPICLYETEKPPMPSKIKEDTEASGDALSEETKKSLNMIETRQNFGLEDCPNVDKKNRIKSRRCITKNVQYTCNDCNFQFKTKKILRKHITRMCNKINKFSCPYCDYTKFFAYEIYAHVKRQHEGKKIHCIDNFKNQSKTSNFKVRHEKKDKEYKCSKCPSMFLTHHRLKRHRMYECTAEKRFGCDYCAFKTKWKSHLSRHIFRSHLSTSVTIKTSNVEGLEKEPVHESKVEWPEGVMTVWQGCIYMADVARFFVTAQNVSGSFKELMSGLPNTFDVIGRVKPDAVWEYIDKMKKKSMNEILIIRLTAINDEEKIPYITLYSYLNSRDRLGVLGLGLGAISPQIKDFYIMPFPSNRVLPSVLLPLDGPGIEENRQHMLLGIIVVHSHERRMSIPASLTPVAREIVKQDLEASEGSYTSPSYVSQTLATDCDIYIFDEE